MSVQALSHVMSIRDVSASEKLVLIVLANFADEAMTAWPSHRRLSEDACLSERTVLTVLKALEQKGYITRQEQRRRDGSRTSDRITLCVRGEMVSPRGEIDDTGVGKQLPQGGEMVSPLTTFEPSPNHQENQASPPDRFEEWWKAYPRRVGKGAARKAYASALRKTSAEALLAALVGYPFDRDMKFVPHPSTWLNGERWTDDAVAPPTGPDPPDADPWPKRLREFHRNGFWNATDWGPKPGKPGCLAPKALLDQAA